MAKICLLTATRQTMLLIPDHLPKLATYWLFIGYLLAIYGRTSTGPQGTHEAAVTRWNLGPNGWDGAEDHGEILRPGGDSLCRLTECQNPQIQIVK